MTGQLTPLIAGGVGVAGGLLTYAVLSWRHKRKHHTVAVTPTISTGKDSITAEIHPDPDEDAEAVKSNPGNHQRVIRCMEKAENIERIEELYHNYMTSPERHSFYEIDVVVARFWMGVKLILDKKNRQEWYFEKRQEIRRMGYSEKDFDKATDRLPKSILDGGGEQG